MGGLYQRRFEILQLYIVNKCIVIHLWSTI
jgi:hypothetical protein